MKKYDNYKDSGIEWIGEIPSHWEVNRFKYLFFEHSGNGFPNELQGRSKGEIPFFKVSDLNKEGITVEYSNNYVSFNDVSDNGWNIVPEKSILTAKIGESLKKNHRKISSVQCIIDNNCLGIEPISINGKYAFYQLRIIDFDWFVNPGAIPSISMEKLRNHFFPISPSPEEQTAIANYLDLKTTEIDELIADKKRLLELYEEEKTAIINQAVTKGINPDPPAGRTGVPMKDSGIEWLGEIPEHWEVKKLSGVCSFVRGNSSFKKDELLNIGNYVALQYGKTYKVDEVDENFNFYVNDGFYKNSQVVNYGDVIIISTSETIEDLGHSAFYNRKDLGLLGGEQILLKPNSTIVNGKYLYYSSKIFTKELQKYATGLKVYRFNINDLKIIYTSIPSIQEQQSIVQHIETETERINQKVATTEKLIELLTEYRQALISEVVTGKIKVI